MIEIVIQCICNRFKPRKGRFTTSHNLSTKTSQSYYHSFLVYFIHSYHPSFTRFMIISPNSSNISFMTRISFEFTEFSFQTHIQQFTEIGRNSGVVLKRSVLLNAQSEFLSFSPFLFELTKQWVIKIIVLVRLLLKYSLLKTIQFLDIPKYSFQNSGICSTEG